MNRTNIIDFQKLKNLIFQQEKKGEQKKAPKSKSELNYNNDRISKDEFFRELRKTLSVLADR